MTKHLFPIFVYPTLHCNFRCSYCFNFSGPRQPSNSFLLNCWSAFLDSCAKLDVPEIRISGGEPLLIPDVKNRCRAIVTHGIQYTLLTNGSLLSKHIGWLWDSPPETLWISYHRNFTSENRFEECVALAASALPRVGVHIFDTDVISKPDLVSRVVRAGAQRIKILSLTPIGRNAEHEGTHPLDRQALDALIQAWQRLCSVKLEVRVESASFNSFSTGAATCVLRQRSLLSVDHDGSIYPCCITLGKGSTNIGSLQYETLETIVLRLSSDYLEIPCRNLLPQISANQACCPLRLETATES